jgi:hypothetical protein
MKNVALRIFPHFLDKVVRSYELFCARLWRATLDMVARNFFIASTAISAPYELTVQNHDDGWVTLTDQHPTAIMVLNGSIHMEQILWL